MSVFFGISPRPAAPPEVREVTLGHDASLFAVGDFVDIRMTTRWRRICYRLTRWALRMLQRGLRWLKKWL